MDALSTDRSSLLLVTASFFLAVFSGCAAVSVKAGKIPVERVGQIQGFEGLYEGKLRLQTTSREIDQPLKERISAQVTLSGQELRLQADTDLAGDGCGSRIGMLKNLSIYEEDQKEIIEGYFEFDRGQCREKIESDQVLMTAIRGASGEGELHLSVIQEYVKTPSARRSAKRPLNIRALLRKK